MKQIIFTTRNAHKIQEVNQIIGTQLSVGGLNDINCSEELPETTGTIAGNATQKAKYVFDNYGGVDCFSEDTGLEIDALGGEPGVDTAHYAGSERDNEKNIQKVLTLLGENENRKARFRTVIALFWEGNLHLFEGVCEGNIAVEKQDDGTGFGYDPIFSPEGYDQTFAQMDQSLKNSLSHRGKAVQLFLDFLKEKEVI